MIHDTISMFQTYTNLHPLFPIVADFLQALHPMKYSVGRTDLSGGIYVNADEYELKEMKDKFIECHKKFIDIHIVIEGMEQIGYCNKNECTVIETYNEEKDLEKLTGDLDFITLKPGYFAVFYPHDAHMPGLRIYNKIQSTIRKMVMKLPVSD